MSNLFLAKSTPPETIAEHTDQVLFQYEQLKACYPTIPNVNWDILYLACLYHDLGKMNTKFQNKINKDKILTDPLMDDKEVPHGYISPAFLPIDDLTTKYDKNSLRILYQTIYYHHHRPDMNFENIKKVLKYDLNQYMNDFIFNKIEVPLKINKKYAKYTINGRIPSEFDDQETINMYIMTKGLLNRLDYAASADSSNKGKGSKLLVEEPNDDLLEKTIAYVNTMGVLNELQEYLLVHKHDNNVVVASTGIGKTEAALCWIGNNKGFFTLPLKVSINAIYDRVKKKIDFEKTGLLHSDMPSEYLKRSEQGDGQSFDITMIERTKQLCMPLTICTLDQLIDFVFKYAGYELKLATLAYSKLVIDEIQMYDPSLVGLLLVGLKQVTELGGKFTIMTATFPPIFEHLMKHSLQISFVKPDKPYLKLNKYGQPIIRHRVTVKSENLSSEAILPEVDEKKVLIILNTVKEAQRIYQELIGHGVKNVNMLHSRYILKDRRKKEEDILAMGKRECTETGVWVTTQVVEASLDIDFDILFTELSDISGLLQRMGRVYRGRELLDGRINVVVFTGDPFPSGISYGKRTIIDPDVFQESKKQLQLLTDTLVTEEKKMELVDKVYSLEALEESNYYLSIKEAISTFRDLKPYEFDKSDVKLRNIQTETVIPSSVYRENEDQIQFCLNSIQTSVSWIEKIKAINELKEYMLSIPLYAFREAFKKGFVDHELIISKWEKVCVVNYSYTLETGLVFKEDQEVSSY